jgi:hypothetical protein
MRKVGNEWDGFHADEKGDKSAKWTCREKQGIFSFKMLKILG